MGLGGPAGQERWLKPRATPESSAGRALSDTRADSVPQCGVGRGWEGGGGGMAEGQWQEDRGLVSLG